MLASPPPPAPWSLPAPAAAARSSFQVYSASSAARSSFQACSASSAARSSFQASSASGGTGPPCLARRAMSVGLVFDHDAHNREAEAFRRSLERNALSMESCAADVSRRASGGDGGRGGKAALPQLQASAPSGLGAAGRTITRSLTSLLKLLPCNSAR
eukprot:361794-Chlamydomonas_euryale.AAC.9